MSGFYRGAVRLQLRAWVRRQNASRPHGAGRTTFAMAWGRYLEKTGRHRHLKRLARRRRWHRTAAVAAMATAAPPPAIVQPGGRQRVLGAAMQVVRRVARWFRGRP